MTRAVLSLGANLGDRLATMQAAVDALAARVTVVAVSPVYETEPVGGVVQPDFLNAVVLVDTDLPPRELLTLALEVEHAAGRARGERWGPRTLDVDLVVYGDVTSGDPAVTLPHPRAHERAFVLRPWLDVDPHAALPQGRAADLLREASGGVRRAAGLALRVPA
ncbi:MAG TPA: 2-amino-4-hydroxy-6-hydroxymethyldihydropteridine diphosphokinase [Frankiaceae bacterium]|nr:2-amino-4-hydroxy-6-hydroxymethyldihydropteridine diphosphokinase [Frankiaceae bacterium]